MPVSNATHKASFSINVGMSEQRLALPQRSPSPFSVPWTCRAPPSSAARLTATAFSVSLWAWMPRLADGQLRLHLADDAIDLVRQRAAIGVAQHDPARAGVEAALRHEQRVVGIGLVAVEEMLGVEQRPRVSARRQRRSIREMLSRFSSRGISSATSTWKSQRLADEADGWRFGREQLGKTRIVGGAAAGPLGHAEGGEARVC